MTQLPPIDNEAFDGEKHSYTPSNTRCSHTLKLVSSIEAKCSKCGAGWTGNNIRELVNSFGK